MYSYKIYSIFEYLGRRWESHRYKSDHPTTSYSWTVELTESERVRKGETTTYRHRIYLPNTQREKLATGNIVNRIEHSICPKTR